MLASDQLEIVTNVARSSICVCGELARVRSRTRFLLTPQLFKEEARRTSPSSSSSVLVDGGGGEIDGARQVVAGTAKIYLHRCCCRVLQIVILAVVTATSLQSTDRPTD